MASTLSFLKANETAAEMSSKSSTPFKVVLREIALYIQIIFTIGFYIFGIRTEWKCLGYWPPLFGVLIAPLFIWIVIALWLQIRNVEVMNENKWKIEMVKNVFVTVVWLFFALDEALSVGDRWIGEEWAVVAQVGVVIV
ncbi:hypothetical protein B0J14DRAFT_655826 [Halenospora varia]|nr:hypothetical protein B0J14DRAFT_655826 [Halenospora varia]